MSRRRVLWRGALAAVLLAGGWLVWRAVSPGVAASLLRPDDPAVLALGQRVYAAHCASCHGVHGEGQPRWREPGPDGLRPAPPHDASGHTWHHPDEQLFAITKYGLARLVSKPDYRTAMPIYEGVLSDEEIVAVLSWIKAQWPAEIRRRHDEINVQYRKSLSQ